MKILLALDASEVSKLALDEVARRAWPAGTSVEVLTVAEPSHLWTTSDTAEEVRHRFVKLVPTAVEQLRARGLKADGLILSGDPKTVILEQAVRSGAELIVVGSHGVSALTRFLLGSVAAAVVRYAPCSVEVVRANTKDTWRILLATDGSECAIEAARSLSSRLWPAGTEVRVLSVVELHLSTVQAFLQPPYTEPAEMESIRADAMQRAEKAVDEAMEILTPTGVKLIESISVLVSGPKNIILDEAAQWDANLIVLGSHSPKDLHRFAMGSVSEAVAMHAACSVEVVRRPMKLPLS